MGCAGAKSAAAVEPDGTSKPSAKAAKPPSSEVIANKVKQAKATRVLALRECGLKQLPAAAAGQDYVNLRTADLAVNSLKALPEACLSWTVLQTLNCSQNAITQLPAGIGQMGGLQKLTLSQNKLSTLPVELSQLGKLKTLELAGNSLGVLPADVFSGAISAMLEELDLSSNGLEELPTSIAALAVLTRLDLSKNRLSALPPGLGELSKLQHLDAASNAIPSLPDGFLVNLTSLSELWLKGNPMERLQLQKSPGFDEFMQRRKQRLDAKIECNVYGKVDLAVCGLE